MEYGNKSRFFFVWILVFIVLAGCVTVPKKQSNPYLGYVYLSSVKGNKKFKQIEIPADLEGYLRQIAKKEYDKRIVGFPRSNDMSIKKRGKYIESLKTEITIGEQDWRSSFGGNLSEKEQKIVLDYWNNTPPQAFKFNGAILNEWAAKLSEAEGQQMSNISKAKKINATISQLQKDKSFRAALEQVETLKPYMLAEAEKMESELKKEGQEHWGKKYLQTLKDLKDAEVYDDENEQQIMGIYYRVRDDIKVFGGGETFNIVLTKWQNVLSENWEGRIEEMGGRKAYWDAYIFARRRYEGYVVNDDYAPEYQTGLKKGVSTWSAVVLGNAIRFYNTLAEESNTDKLYGKAYVYCCMAKEMYDFSFLAGFGQNQQVLERYEWLSEWEETVLDSLKSRMARRLIVYNFEYDELGLANKFRQACAEKYASGNDHAWEMEVITDKVTLVQLEEKHKDVKPAEPADYVVEWKWSPTDYDIKEKVGANTPSYVFIKTDRKNVVDNPFRRDRDSEFHGLRQVKVQEVDQYHLSTTPKSIVLSCKVDVTCLNHGVNQFKLAGTKQYIKDTNDDYGKITDVRVTLSRKNVSDQKQYFLPDRYNNTIPEDVAPKDSTQDVPSEEEIEKELTGKILEDADVELQELIDMYPIELLADTDPVNEPDEYFDALGTVLFYVVNLSSMEAARQRSAGEGYEWLHLRNQVIENTEKWCQPGERWGAISKDKNTIMSSLWEECVNAENKQDGSVTP